ncbi:MULTISPECIES: DUF4189 domain-containing protein [Neisseria]|jgi:hypothetical protein|uniref:DUF4189 domain-containing protein n=1 Tax=Neisseria TaxID=482 RepID=UPI00066B10A4|nr:DUF4189 domain-containing protein [Neisseria subflava]
MKKLFSLALGLISLNAYADPTYDATRGALQNNPALCSYGYNPNCSSGSSTPPPKKIIYHDVMVPSKFGALAVSVKAGYIAGSLNHGSKEEAQREAVKRCRQGSRNTPCKAITWVRNGCLAAAKGKVKNNQFILSDAAGPQGTVEQTALQNCRNRGATECEIIMPEGCSLPQLQ